MNWNVVVGAMIGSSIVAFLVIIWLARPTRTQLVLDRIRDAPPGGAVWLPDADYRLVLNWIEDNRCMLMATDDGLGVHCAFRRVYPASAFDKGAAGIRTGITNGFTK